MKGAAPRALLWPGAVLGILYICVVAAPFLAPYDPLVQDRDYSFAPPTRVRFVDGSGVLHLRPFTYALSRRPGTLDEFDEDRSRRYDVRFFVRGKLVGVDEPGRLFVLGTDEYGRDVLSRFLHGGRISLLAGVIGALLSLACGVLLGTAAGFYGSWIDEAVMRVGEVFLALPWLYLLLAVRVMLPLDLAAGATFLMLVVVLGLAGWARPARLIRGVTMSARTGDYVLASRGFGASNFHVLRRHVIPQLRGIVLTQAAILVPQFTLAEVTLSFFGLGVGEPVPSWGNLLATLQQYHVAASYWWMFVPAAALVPFFLLYYWLADGLHHRTAFSQ